MRFNRRHILQLMAAAAGLPRPGWADDGRPVLRAPPDAPANRSEPGLVTFRLEARVVYDFITDRPVELWTYNGELPGATMTVRAGETVRIRFRNGLPEATNLHFHGLHVPPTGNADNIWLSIPPNEGFDYEFTVPETEAGTYWYHPHHHGALARQLWMGLAGAFIVRGPVDDLPEIAAADERVILLRDLAIEDKRPAAHKPLEWLHGKQGDLVLVNGLVQPRLEARASLVRLRLINTANARYFDLRLAGGRPFHLIAADGHFLERPVTLDRWLISPASRADILVELTDDRPLDLVYVPYDRGASRLPRKPTTLITIVPSPVRQRVLLPGRLAEIPRLSVADAQVRRKVIMAMLKLNGQPFKMHRVDAAGRLGDLELWQVVNLGAMDHNFHIHTWYFQIAALNGRPPPFRAWRDTINLRSGDRADLLIPLRDYTGKTVYHCHIAEHGDIGMMGIIEVTDSG